MDTEKQLHQFRDKEKLQRLKEKFPGLWLAAKGMAHGKGMTVIQWIAEAIEEKIAHNDNVQ
jgi:phosphoribosylamine-glycine ligase